MTTCDVVSGIVFRSRRYRAHPSAASIIASMAEKPKGKALESEVFERIKDAVAKGDLGLNPNNTKVFLNKRYHSRDRKGFIETDVAVELWRAGATSPTLIWIWECKDLTRPVDVTHIEALHARFERIGADNTKGTLISRNALTKQALAYARAKGIGVARLFEEYIAHVASYTTLSELREAQNRAKDAFERLSERLDDIMQEQETPDIKWDLLTSVMSGYACFGYLTDGKPAHGGTVATYIFGEIVMKIAQNIRRERRQIAVRSTIAMAIGLLLGTWSLSLAGVLRIAGLGSAAILVFASIAGYCYTGAVARRAR